MTDIWWPSWLVPSKMFVGLDDFTAVDSSATTGSVQTSELYGTRRWRVRMDFETLSRSDGTLQIFEGILASMRGRSNRIWLKNFAYQQRGSFPGSELLTNNTFDGGTTGWQSGATSVLALSATDRSLRATQLSGASGSSIRRASPATTL